MPTYEIQAPDGKTYQIDGPDGATPDQVRAQVLAHHPEAGAAPEPDKPSWLARHGRDLASGTGAVLGAVIGAPIAALDSIPTLGVGGLATEIGAGALGAGIGGQGYDLVQKMLGHGTPTTPGQRVASALRDVTAGGAGVAGGQIIGGAVRAAAPFVAPVVAPVVSKVAAALSSLKNAGPAASDAVAAVRAQAVANALKQAKGAAADTRMATTTAAQAQTAQQTAQALADSPKPIGIGDVTHLSEQGAPAQAAAQAGSQAADAARQAAYQQYTDAIDGVVKANEANGKYINDTPAAQKLLDEANAKLSPNSVSAPTAAPLPTSGQARAYKMVQDALQNRPVELTPAQAEESAAMGYDVQQTPGKPPYGDVPGVPTYSRTFKTPLEAVQNLRRWFGDAAYGKADVSGFDGVNASTFRDLNAKLGEIEDQYTANLGGKQRAAYTAALDKMKPYQRGVGKQLTATAPGTDISTMPSANVPQAVIGGGADTFAQFKAITDPKVAAKFANDAVETALHDPITGGPKGYDAAVKAVAPGTKLGDMINSVPSLKTQVQQHLNQLLDAKNAGVQATEFGQKFDTASAAKNAASQARLGWQSQVVQLRNLPDSQVLPAAESMFNRLATEGKISPTQQQQYIQQIRDTAKTVGVKAARDQVIKWGLAAAGAGAATEAGMHTAKMMGQ